MLQAVNRNYALIVFWIYVAMFVVTCSMIFVFPPGALAMVFIGLLGLLLAVIGGQLLKLIEHAVAKLAGPALLIVVATLVTTGCSSGPEPAPATVFISGSDRAVLDIAGSGYVELKNYGPGSVRLAVVQRSNPAVADARLPAAGAYTANADDVAQIVVVSESGESTTIGWVTSKSTVEVSR
jgi:hypothetical protein